MGQYVGMGMSAMQSVQGMASSLSALSALPSQEQSQSDAARSRFLNERSLLTRNLSTSAISQSSHSKRGQTVYY